MSDTPAPPRSERSPGKGRTRRPLRVSLGIAGCLLLLLGGGFLLLRPTLAWQPKLRAARDALQRGDFHKARAAWEECLQIAPASTEAHLGMARACRMTGDFKSATTHVLAARQTGSNRDDVDIEQLLLRAHYGEANQVLAELMTRVPDGSPRVPDAQEALALGYLTSGQLNAARKCTEKLIESRPDYWLGYWIRGALEEREQRLPEATRDFQHVLKLFPEQADARLWLARNQVTNKDHQTALENFQRLLSVKSVQAEAALGAAECYRALGQPREAMPLLAAAVDDPKTRGRALLQRGLLALDSESPQQALDWLRQAAAIPPPSVELYQGFSAAFRKLGDTAQATQAEDLVNRLQSDLKEIERIAARIRQLEVGKDKGEYLQLLTQMGGISLRIGNADRGLNCLENALRESPEYKPALLALADYYEKKGDADRARGYRERAR